MTSNLPLMRSVTAGPVPLYGTWSILIPADFWNSSADKWEAAPTPEEPNDKLSGFSRAIRIRSAVELAGNLGVTVTI
jgi:hypothetical protein